MQYALLYYEKADELARRRGAEADRYWASWTAYMKMLNESGAMRGGAGLEPPHMATRVANGGTGRVVEDGPFAEAREELGGFVLVEVDDLDAALRLAAEAPCAKAGHVEVRPTLHAPGN